MDIKEFYVLGQEDLLDAVKEYINEYIKIQKIGFYKKDSKKVGKDSIFKISVGMPETKIEYVPCHDWWWWRSPYYTTTPSITYYNSTDDPSIKINTSDVYNRSAATQVYLNGAATSTGV